MKRLLPPSLVALLALAMGVVTLVAPWPNLPPPIRIAGLAIAGGGIVLTMRHAALFTKIGTNIKTFDDPVVLVQQGAFSWTRNPMYLGFLLILGGLAIALGSLAAFVGPAAFFIAADRWYIPFEERRMAATFDTGYALYQSRTRRWVGRRRAP